MYDSIYYISRRWMKTQLEVQANRLCNVVILCDCSNSNDVTSFAPLGRSVTKESE